MQLGPSLLLVLSASSFVSFVSSQEPGCGSSSAHKQQMGLGSSIDGNCVEKDTAKGTTLAKLNESIADGCVKCVDYNRRNSDLCAYNYTLCGDCLVGFAETDSEEDKGVCDRIEILKSPHVSVTSQEENDLYLECEFNVPIVCVWQRDGAVMPIGGPGNRYQFHNGSVTEATKTKTCSLIIYRLTTMDEGHWQCSSKADSESQPVQSTLSHVQIHRAIIVEQPQDANVTFGSQLTLKCVFNEEVTCVWMKKGPSATQFEIVTITGNKYRFEDSTLGTKKNCSVVIAGMEQGDEGQWNCSDVNGKTQSTVATVSAYQPDPQPVCKSPHISIHGQVVDGQKKDLEQLEGQVLNCSVITTPLQLQWRVAGLNHSLTSAVATNSITFDLDLLRDSSTDWPLYVIKCEAIYSDDVTNYSEVYVLPITEAEENLCHNLKVGLGVSLPILLLLLVLAVVTIRRLKCALRKAQDRSPRGEAQVQSTTEDAQDQSTTDEAHLFNDSEGDP